jgi:hypothetical protein
VSSSQSEVSFLNAHLRPIYTIWQMEGAVRHGTQK